jgi:hypothetical protein
MNLARHAAVLWRYRVITAACVLLGVVLAIAASYKITTAGVVARGTSTYSSMSHVLVTQPGFPEGRVVLPTAPTGAEAEQKNVDPNRLEFADPNRFMALADLYTKLLVSDDVRSRTPGHPTQKQILASPLPAVSGAPILPIIELTVTAKSSAAARQLNTDMVRSLRGLLKERQARNDISPAQSVQISILNAPTKGVLTSGPSRMGSILAFLLCLIGAVAVTHLLENLRTRRASEAPADFDAWEDGERESDLAAKREVPTPRVAA